MSAPNADKPNEGIVGQIGNSISNAANYVSETVQGQSKEASKEANKQQAKGNTADDSLSGRASGALGAAGDALDQKKHEICLPSLFFIVQKANFILRLRQGQQGEHLNASDDLTYRPDLAQPEDRRNMDTAAS